MIGWYVNKSEQGWATSKNKEHSFEGQKHKQRHRAIELARFDSNDEVFKWSFVQNNIENF